MIEFEKVRTIRKRAMTMLVFCSGCKTRADAVLLIEAAVLFETGHDELFQFIKKHHCHYHVSKNNKIYLCVPSLLEQMSQKNNIRRLSA